MRKLILTFTVTLFTLICQGQKAWAGEITGTASLDYVSAYIDRNVTLAGPAIQPGLEVSMGGVTIGSWVSIAAGQNRNIFPDQIDIFASYEFTLSDAFVVSVGATLTHDPYLGGVLNIGDSGASTIEFDASVSFNTDLSPTLTAYYDVHANAFTLEGALEQAFALSEHIDFELGATLGLVDMEAGGDYQYGFIGGGVRYSFADTTSLYINVNAGVSSEETFLDTSVDFNDASSQYVWKKSSMWVGVGMSRAF